MAVTRSSNTSGIISNPSVISKLVTISGIDGTTPATHTLYTVPVGNSMVVVGVTVRVTAANTSSVSAQGSFGSNGTDLNNWSGIGTFGPYLINTGIYTTSTGFAIYSAGDIFKLKITTGGTATTQTLAVDVFGYLF